MPTAQRSESAASACLQPRGRQFALRHVLPRCASLAVLQEGQVTAGDSIDVLARDEHGVTVADIVNLYKTDATNQDLLCRASELPALPSFWREHFRKRLWDPDS